MRQSLETSDRFYFLLKQAHEKCVVEIQIQILETLRIVRGLIPDRKIPNICFD
jgi:hypothetical protein